MFLFNSNYIFKRNIGPPIDIPTGKSQFKGYTVELSMYFKFSFIPRSIISHPPTICSMITVLIPMYSTIVDNALILTDRKIPHPADASLWGVSSLNLFLAL